MLYFLPYTSTFVTSALLYKGHKTLDHKLIAGIWSVSKETVAYCAVYVVSLSKRSPFICVCAVSMYFFKGEIVSPFKLKAKDTCYYITS